MSEKKSARKRKKQRRYSRGRRRRRLILSLVLAGTALLLLIFVLLFKVRRVEVVGNDHLTNQEIEEMVTDGVFGKNAAFLWLAYRGRKIEGNSFIDTISVGLSSPWSVRIRVEEKKLAGYIREKDTYWYFDAGGIARVSSKESELMCLRRVQGRKTEEDCTVTEEGFLKIGDTVLSPSQINDGGNYIPLVLGARAVSPALGQPLNESQAGSFRIVAAAKNYIDKCSFRPDSVEITPEGRIWLHIGDVVVDLGSDGRVEIKLRELEGIYPKLLGRRGTLHLENYDGTRNRIIFSAEEEEEEFPAEGEDSGEEPFHEDAAGEQSAGESMAEEQQPAEENTAEGQQSEEENTEENTEEGQQPAEENTEEGQQPAEENAGEEGQQPTGENAAEGQPSAEENTEENTEEGQQPAEENVAEGQQPAEENAAEGQPSAEENAAADGQQPAEENAADGQQPEEVNTEEGQQPAAENAAEGQQTEEVNTEEGQQPAGENAADGQQPAEENAAEG